MSNLKAFSEARKAADDAEIARLEAEIKEEVEIQEIEDPAGAPDDSEEATWRKRFGDSRRYLQAKEKSWEQERAQLLAQLEEARTSSGAVPVERGVGALVASSSSSSSSGISVDPMTSFTR